MKVPHDEVSSYGVIDPQGEGVNGLYSVETFVEKPKPEDAPSGAPIKKKIIHINDKVNLLIVSISCKRISLSPASLCY